MAASRAEKRCVPGFVEVGENAQIIENIRMELILDGDLKSVVEFMQSNIATSKLVGVAESLPKLAKLLWDRYPQEPLNGLSLCAEPLTVSTSCETQRAATV